MSVVPIRGKQDGVTSTQSREVNKRELSDAKRRFVAGHKFSDPLSSRLPLEEDDYSADRNHRCVRNIMNILLTGATGFIGRHVSVSVDSEQKFKLTAAVRSRHVKVRGKKHFVDRIDGETNWRSVLGDTDVIIHAAARVPSLTEDVASSLAEYRSIDVSGTLNLASQGAEAGVRRFIFISSLKVNGDQTLPGQRFTAADVPAPKDAYGLSKWESERGLLKIASDTGMEVVIIRPPLVYGRGVGGNFAKLMNGIKNGVPLPLGAIRNQRSLVFQGNLVDLIITCVTHVNAANQIFMVSDGQDVSTTELVRGISSAAGVRSRLIPVPSSLLLGIASVLRKKSVAQRLLGSLQVDITKTRDLLGWSPPYTLKEGLDSCFVEIENG